jgi:hypothetical protein
MEAANLENANNLISDGHDPNDGDEESHRTAQNAHSWVFSLRREYENEDGSCDTSDGGGN